MGVKPPHHHFYLFSLRRLRKIVVGTYSFHHGESCFPSRGNFLSTMVERKKLHGGKNKRSDGKG
nr:hypothetical protein [Bacteroides intestinalis]